ncbi:MAG: hypothetical protein AB8F94_29625 [Saprospiraceae bacterium]
MKKYVAIYNSTPEAKAQMVNITPEQAAEGMKPWAVWKEKCGSALVDMGAPLVAGQLADTSGNRAGSGSNVSGYSIVQGESLEDVKALFKDHPHLSWAPDSSIEIFECAAI